MSVIAIIPARSGSKGVIGKNIRPLAGFPILAYSIIAAKLTPEISRVIVSTDSIEYAEIANKFGAETPFLRPDDISCDSSTDLEVFEHVLNWLKINESFTPEFILHLRPTTPLRDPLVISEALKYLNTRLDASSLRSGHLASESPFKWLMKDDNGFFKGVLPNLTAEQINLPRQDFPPVYVPSAYVDILKSDCINEEKSLHGNRMLVFESPHCIEIDNYDDFSYLEHKIEREGSILLDYLKANF
jgi:CMP-N,N'-diacetyllegionaminic acid synthase